MVDIPSVCVEDAVTTIKQLIHHAAAGHDNIPDFVIKGISNLFLPAVMSICNWCLQCGVFPQHWKKPSVTPTPKPGIPNICNFRPISIRSSFIKIIEKIVFSVYIVHSIGLQFHFSLAVRFYTASFYDH